MQTLKACVALIALAPAICCSEELRADREVWSVYVEGDVRYGSEHLTVTRQANGQLHYRVETRSLVELLGQKQESTSTATYIVSPELEPVAVTSRTKQLSGSVELSGKSQNGVLQLRRDSHGVQRSAEIQLSSSPIFLACLPDWLQRQPQARRKLVVSVINEETLEVDRAECELIEDKAGTKTWQVAVPMGPVMSRGRLVIKDGVVLSQEMSVPKMTMVQSVEQDARNIQYLRFAPRSLLMFPVGKDIQRTDLLTSLSVRLTWNDIALEKFNLEDSRQRIVSHDLDDGAHRVVVRIEPSEKPDDGDGVPFPIRQSGLETFLAESQYIKPADPNIARTARLWTQDCQTAKEAVEAISNGISELLSGGEMIAETLSGPEVLQCRKGKCTEYSTLFASLARSVGIPTRIVLGDRMINGMWAGHMWNEAWIGRWVTVDASTNEVGDAPALLKFVHSDTVMGTQDLRWALTDSLDVSIVDYAVGQPKTDPSWKTGIAEGTYTNSEFGCRISVPKDNWTLENKSKAGQVLIRARVPDEHVLIHFAAYSLPLPLGAEKIIGIRDLRYRSSFKKYEVVHKKAIKRKDREWYCLQFKRNPGQPEIKRIPNVEAMKVSEYVWHKGTTGFLINIIADEQAHGHYESQFLEFVDSFRLQSESDGLSGSKAPPKPGE